MATELKLPDVGDNIEKGTVVTILVNPGDSVTEGQPIIELETDKAVVEVPSNAAGTVQSVNVKIGDTIPVGGVIATLTGAEGAGSSAPSLPDNAAEPDSATVAGDEATAQRVAAAQIESQKEQAQTTPPAQAPAAAPSAPQTGGTTQVTLPDVGDNIEKGTVVTILVNPGDSVTEGQPVIELETDKAVVEVPSNAAGTVQSVDVKIGDTLKVGSAILTLSGGASAALAQAATPAPASPAAQAPAAPAAPTPTAAPASTPAQAPQAAQTFDGRPVVHAAPSVRRLARELGVDIATVHGTGPVGRITEDDVRGAANAPATPAASAPAPQAAATPAPAAPAAPAPVAAPLPDFNKWGATTREDMSGIRRATVRSMTQAWTTIPMVTHFDKADITLMEETRRRFSARVEKAGGKLTMTHILMKVAANALRKYPKFGASLDLANEQVIFKDYVNIGVAVDTPVGLLVPVVKNADRKSITEMVVDLSDLAARARDRKLKPDEMQGATFTISNLGGIGGHAFTPIVNSPEVAILGVSRGGMEPVWNKDKGEFEPRNMLPLSLTYDHRLIDGADAARFLRFICESLEDPFLISL
ncbi:dihydrolipoyllysine-residue acetyltransferase [Deinococcus ficus]|uniref:Acetyltransferase component of pyruvate dehydrogenase complex n=1 Tax=Deinococcus ficus TaxID=317577 RepID=A0A221SYT6_9DEIO|nr:dihydrolipoyllysine-residue acetyltransferase [Deinococcus ficus]ASN81809.1 dihydrolipoyllysine-residue acetyltransferase [Deinococcus ficus]